MGCGSVRRAQIVIYINEATPPLATLVNNDKDAPTVFPPSGLVKRGDDTYFDDKELIKQCQAVHVDRLVVYCGDMVTGLEITYCLDQAILKRSHCVTTEGVQHRLELMEEESIMWVECTYSENGVHSLLFKTNKSHQLSVEGKVGPGSQSITQSFVEEKRGIVGFKGCYSKFLKSLGVYTWKMRRS